MTLFYFSPALSPFSPCRTAGGGVEVTQRGAAQVPLRAGPCGAGQRSGAAAAALRMEPAALGRGGRPRDAGGGGAVSARGRERGRRGAPGGAEPPLRPATGGGQGGKKRALRGAVSAGRARGGGEQRCLPAVSSHALPLPEGSIGARSCSAKPGDTVTQDW